MFINCFNSKLKVTNLKKKYYTINEENVITNNVFHQPFGSLIEINNKKILFLTNGKDDFTTMPQRIEYYESDDGITFKKNESCDDFYLKAFCNNATIIKKDNIVIGIGGRHVAKRTQETHNIINCECKTKNYHPRIIPPFKLCKCQFYNNGHGILPFLNNDFFSKCYMNGVYCITGNSEKEINLHNFKLIQDFPIINGMNNGLIDRVFGATTFDSQNSLIFNKKDNLFYFYCRSNHMKGGRSIQYSRSNNLINWEDFKYIISNSFDYSKDNYYCPNFFYYPEEDMYMGLLTSHVSNSGKSSLKLLYSENLVDWIEISTLLSFKGNELYLFEKNIAHNGITLSLCKKYFYFYMIHNFEKNGKWVRYSIRKDGFVSYITENIEGTIELENKYNITNNIYINFRCLTDDGYLNFKLINDNKLVYNIKLQGDEILKDIIIPENIKNKKYKIVMELNNSEFFSLKL